MSSSGERCSSWVVKLKGTIKVRRSSKNTEKGSAYHLQPVQHQNPLHTFSFGTSSVSLRHNISQPKQSQKTKTRVPLATSTAQTKSQKKKRLSTAPQTHRGPLSLAELCSQRSRLTKSRKELQDRDRESGVSFISWQR